MEKSSKSKEKPTYIYNHKCIHCGRVIAQTLSHIYQSESRGTGFCENCDKDVETIIELSNYNSPAPLYSKDNPYGV